MTKTPEQYFMENVSVPEGHAASGDLSQAEKAFLDKYVGVGHESLLSSVERVDPRSENIVAQGVAVLQPEQTEEPPAIFDLAAEFKKNNEIQLVSFIVGKAEYALPITLIQEVIRLVPLTKVPKAPVFVAGVINLRGRVTLLLSLRKLLRKGMEISEEERFIVICRHQNVQIGLLIDAVATMYKAGKEDVELNVGSEGDSDADFVTALIKSGERLICILSIDHLLKGVFRF